MVLRIGSDEEPSWLGSMSTAGERSAIIHSPQSFFTSLSGVTGMQLDFCLDFYWKLER